MDPPMSIFAQRRDKLLAHDRQEGLDALLVTNPVNVTYLTGFSGEATYLVLGREKTVLISDGRFVEQLAEECPGLDAYIRPTGQILADAASQVLGKMAAAKVGFESGHLTVADFETIKSKAGPIDWKPGPSRVEALRTIKDESELAQIREAIAIAEAAFGRFTREMRPEHTEKQLHDAMEFHVRALGGKITSFPTIVAVGSRAALPHAPPSDRRLRDAPFVLVDWGASGRFYKSDLTRVLWTHKPISNSGLHAPLREKFLRVADVVRNAQLAALKRMRVGAVLQDIDAAARAVIADAGFGEFFNHGLGHGFGLQIHEAPFMRPTNTDVLAAGMVITVEPGVYIPGEIGVRIEDDVLITADGPEVLTTLPRSPDDWGL
jgi:Xaa-Pro aminopeptidase